MSNRTKHDVKTTKDMVSIVTVSLKFTGDGGATVNACTGTIYHSTDQKLVESTTSYVARLASGSFRVTLPTDNNYRQLLGMHSTAIQGTVGDRHEIRLTSGSGDAFTFLVTSSSGSTGRDPLTTDALSGSFTMIVRDTNRSV